MHLTSDSLPELLERMRATREELGQHLAQVPALSSSSAQLMQKTLTPGRLAVALGVALAMAAFFRARRQKNLSVARARRRYSLAEPHRGS
jgi:hypothetical protein